MHCFSLKYTLARQECVYLIKYLEELCLDGNTIQLIQYQVVRLFFGVMDWATRCWDSQRDCHVDHGSANCLLTPKIFIHCLNKSLQFDVYSLWLSDLSFFSSPNNSCFNKRNLFLSLVQSKLTWLLRHSQGAKLLWYHCSNPPRWFALVSRSETTLHQHLSQQEGRCITLFWAALLILSAPPNHSWLPTAVQSLLFCTTASRQCLILVHTLGFPLAVLGLLGQYRKCNLAV